VILTSTINEHNFLTKTHNSDKETSLNHAYYNIYDNISITAEG